MSATRLLGTLGVALLAAAVSAGAQPVDTPTTAPTTAPAGRWGQPVAVSEDGAIGSPGGTHPLAIDGDAVHAVWVQGGHIHYRRSTDGGVTWDKATQLTSHGTAVYPCSLELSGSTLHLIWPDSRNGGAWEVRHRASRDGGATWGPETRVTHGANLFRMGTAVCGDTVHVVRDNKTVLEKVPAGDSTWTWTWGEIYYTRSTDGGVTWEKEVRLTKPDASAIRPVVAACDQYVHVAWADRRDARQRPGWDWEVYCKRSTDGGATWGPDLRMTDTPEHTRHPQIVATQPDRVCCIWEDGQKFDGTKMVGDAALYAALSKDNGKTWDAPRRITLVNAPKGWATHAKTFLSGSRIHLVWTDTLAGTKDPPRAQAAYYMTSPDCGLTWGPAELLAGGAGGSWGAAGTAGTDTRAIALLSLSAKLYVSVKPAPRHSGSPAPHRPPGGPAAP